MGIFFCLFGCKELSSAQAAKPKRIASFTVLDPCAPEGPNNMLFLRYVALDYKPIDKELVEVIRKIFLKHFNAWKNPTNAALNVHSKNPAYKVDHLKDQDPDQSLLESVDMEALALKRTPMKSFFSKASEQTPCVHTGNIKF